MAVRQGIWSFQVIESRTLTAFVMFIMRTDAPPARSAYLTSRRLGQHESLSFINRHTRAEISGDITKLGTPAVHHSCKQQMFDGVTCQLFEYCSPKLVL